MGIGSDARRMSVNMLSAAKREGVSPFTRVRGQRTGIGETKTNEERQAVALGT